MNPYFIDSNVFIGAYNPRDEHHGEAAAILKRVDRGELGTAIITDYILDEVLTFVRRKLGAEKSLEVLNAILSSENVDVAKIDEEIFDAAIVVFEKYKRLSFTDATTVTYMNAREIQKLISFDGGFDGIKSLIRITKV